MLVVDASVVVELLVAPGRPDLLMRLPDAPWSAPHLLDTEVLSALRRLEHVGLLTKGQAGRAVDELGRLDLFRYPAEPLRSRVWQLRANLTPYDATYVALAEELDLPLLTTDARLARAPGIRATVEILA
jgi:predicted nucleic acid-binding protein